MERGSCLRRRSERGGLENGCHCVAGLTMTSPNLNTADRRTVLDAVLRTIDTKFMGPNADTGALRATHEPAVVNADSVADFEAAMNAMLRELGVSHTGFFHESAPRTAGRVALAATFTK